MKLILLIIAIFFIVSCNSVTQINNPEGLYTCNYQHEFARTEDTMELKRLDAAGNFFQISRHSGVIRQMDGKEFPKELLVETWKLEYDESKKVFTDMKKGKTIMWDDQKEILILGNRQYSRVAK